MSTLFCCILCLAQATARPHPTELAMDASWVAEMVPAKLSLSDQKSIFASQTVEISPFGQITVAEFKGVGPGASVTVSPFLASNVARFQVGRPRLLPYMRHGGKFADVTFTLIQPIKVIHKRAVLPTLTQSVVITVPIPAKKANDYLRQLRLALQQLIYVSKSRHSPRA